MDAPERGERATRAHRAGARVCVPPRWVRHEGWARPAAQLAAGCPCGGPDAHLRSPVGAPAQCGHLRGRAMQGTRRRFPTFSTPLADAHELRIALGVTG